MIGPLVGGIIDFGIIVGTLLRVLLLLYDLSNRLMKEKPKPVKVKDTYDKYLKEKGIDN